VASGSLADDLTRPAARFGTEKALEPLRRVNAAGTHLLSLINEILDLSKIEAGKLELNPEPVNCRGLSMRSSAPRDNLPRRTRTGLSLKPRTMLARSRPIPCGSSRFYSIF
jgi:signal transduction histidine kinase